MPYSHNKVTPYSADEKTKKEQVSNMFDNIAPYYDFLNRFLSLGIDRVWRRKAIKQIASTEPDVVLDVATGTADLAIEIARQTKAKKIIGVDISEEMLSYGRKKLVKGKLNDRIKLEQGDSENLAFQAILLTR